MKRLKLKKLDAQKELWKCYESMTRKELIETCKQQHLEMIETIKHSIEEPVHVGQWFKDNDPRTKNPEFQILQVLEDRVSCQRGDRRVTISMKRLRSRGNRGYTPIKKGW